MQRIFHGKARGVRVRHMVDLYSGLGCASESMVRAGWSVLRIENNPLLSAVPFTVMQDAKLLRWKVDFRQDIRPLDLIWASPPCRDFSNAYGSPKSIHAREHGIESYKPDMSLLEAAIAIIEKVKPKYWVIENVVGSIKYFEKYLGKPRQIIGPYVLWGNFPFLEVDDAQLTPKKKKDKTSTHPLRSNHKACVDYAISDALRIAIEQQKSITDF